MRYVAQFIGSPSMNVLRGRLVDGAFSSNDFRLPMHGCDVAAPPLGAREAWLGIRPEHVLTGREVEQASVHLDVAAELVEPMGSDAVVWARLAGEPFCIQADGRMRIQAGERLAVGIDPSLASLFDAGTELRL